MLTQRQEKGLKAPALDNRPSLFPWLEWVLSSFHTLSTERDFDSMAGVPKPLKFTEVSEFFYRLGVERSEFWIFYRLLKTLDNSYLTYKMKEKEARDKKNKRGSRGKR